MLHWIGGSLNINTLQRRKARFISKTSQKEPNNLLFHLVLLVRPRSRLCPINPRGNYQMTPSACNASPLRYIQKINPMVAHKASLSVTKRFWNKNTNSESSLVQAIQNTKSIKSTLYCDFDKIRSQLASVCVHLVILIHFLLRFKSKWQQPLLPGSFTSFHTLMNIPCSQPSSFCFSFKLPCSMHKLFRIPICFIYKSFVMSIYYKERQSSTDLNWKGICVRLVKLDDVTRWAKEPASDAQIGPISVFSRLTWWALNITSWKQDLSWEIATILNIRSPRFRLESHLSYPEHPPIVSWLS